MKQVKVGDTMYKLIYSDTYGKWDVKKEGVITEITRTETHIIYKISNGTVLSDNVIWGDNFLYHNDELEIMNICHNRNRINTSVIGFTSSQKFIENRIVSKLDKMLYDSRGVVLEYKAGVFLMDKVGNIIEPKSVQIMVKHNGCFESTVRNIEDEFINMNNYSKFNSYVMLYEPYSLKINKMKEFDGYFEVQFNFVIIEKKLIKM